MTLGILRIFKAFASNQLAKFSPQTYVRLTKQTGRGSRDTESPTDIASYFIGCVADYFRILGIPDNQQSDFVQNKVILEYGPGDFPGVALLFMALGAKKVFCVDRFQLVNASEKNIAVLKVLIEKLPRRQRERLLECLIDPKNPEVGFVPAKIEYLVKKDGLSELDNEIDFVISRAVLEHVNDLEGTFLDISKAMRPGALAVHQVDLKSHGLHRSNPLDFLQYSPWLWSLMYSHKGVPNRLRSNYYRQVVAKYAFDNIKFQPTTFFDQKSVVEIFNAHPKQIEKTPLEELAWQGFWLTFRKQS